MSASCEIKTRVVHRKEKNGDTYILERKEQYDPAKKYNRILSTKLIAKIPKGETVPVPTRPKKKHKTDKPSSVAMENSPISEDTATSADTAKAVSADSTPAKIDKASRTVDSKEAGIDDAISTDKGTAQKIISIAKFIVVNVKHFFRDTVSKIF